MNHRVAIALLVALSPSLALAQDAQVATTPATAAAAPVTPTRARAPDAGLDSWPVRVHLSMPLGSTFGHDHLQGFSWGFRGALQVYPTRGFRGVGVGGFAEMLLDAETRQYATFGGVVTGPIVSWPWGGLRAGGMAGARYRGDADPRGAALELGAQVELVVPAYLYDLSLGLRVDTMIDETGLVATSLLVDVDLAVLVAMVGAAGIR